jgi:hypothetical protein
MKYILLFENFSDNTIYGEDWKKFVPDSLVVIKGDTTDLNGYILDAKTRKPTNQLCKYKLGNLMANQVYQITYDRDFDILGIPDTLEMDVSILNSDDGKFKLSVEITFGDLVASGFTVQKPNKVDIFEYTSYHSQGDPSDTVFAFSESSLKKLIPFINHFDGLNVTRADLNFLDNRRFSYRPK